ncbi:MAG: hypothetical protein DRQ06_04570 [Candidatus Hydrothermota bacterium]|nr:MAG: hypothetical protein DRQ06_04570 [Candidatus Hydrothermae bacterium]
MNRILKVLTSLGRGPVNSIRHMAVLCGWPYETTRRWIGKLGSLDMKRSFAQWVLRRWADDQEYVVVAVDPTYLKGFEEGILVACLVVQDGRAVPLYWERFSWSQMDKEREGLYSRNTFQRNFVLRLKELVYPRKLVLIADREFGRRSFLKFLKKKGIYWVIRHPKHSWPPPCGEGIAAHNAKQPSEPYLLSFRLPSEEMNPVFLYLKRMTIEETFRDAKTGFLLTRLIGRVKREDVKRGLIFLVFAALAFTMAVAQELRDSPDKDFLLSLSLPLTKGLRGLIKRGYYSTTYLGRLCLTLMGGAVPDITLTAPRTCNEIRMTWGF